MKDNREQIIKEYTNSAYYYMIFYKYQNSKTWQHSGLHTDSNELLKAILARPYIDPETVIVKTIILPN